MRLPAGLLAGGVLLGIGGCDRGEPAPPTAAARSSPDSVVPRATPPATPPAVTRIRWASEALPEEGSLAATLGVAQVTSRSQITAEHFQVVAGRGPKEWRLLLSGATDPLCVRLPYEASVASFNELRLRVQTPAGTSVSGVLRRGDKVLLVLPPHRCRGEDVEELWFSVPQTGLRQGRCDRLDLEFRGAGGPVAFLEAQLWKHPLSYFVPPEPRRVRLGNQSRPAVGLTANGALTGEGSVQGEAAVLFFSLAVPRGFGASDAHLAVRVTAPGAAPRDRTLALPEDEQWVDCRIPLVPGPFQVRLELEGPELSWAACLVAESRVEQRHDPHAPTVVLVTSDTHRSDHLAAANGRIPVETPTLDALAARGMLFENCFSSTNVTNPSHTALLTGLHPLDHGIVNNYTHASSVATTLAEEFRDAGYVTLAAVSAYHLRDRQSGLGQGFDRMSGPVQATRPAAETLQDLLGVLPSAEGLPLFVWLHVYDAHEPYALPPRSKVKVDYPAGRDPADPGLPPLPPEEVPDWMPGVRDPEYLRALYRASISYLDSQLQQLFSLSRVQEGIIAFTADHGESLGNHDIYWTHAGLYPDTVHVPLILAGPGIPPGSRNSRPVRQIDVGYTLLELAGLPGTGFPGRSLLALPDEDPPRFTFAAHGRCAAVQSGDWYLVLYLVEETAPPHARHSVELFNLRTDPDCLHDVVGEQHELAGRLRAQLVQRLAQPSTQRLDGDAQEPDPEALEELEALGYVGEDELSARAEVIGCTCTECARF